MLHRSLLFRYTNRTIIRVLGLTWTVSVNPSSLIVNSSLSSLIDEPVTYNDSVIMTPSPPKKNSSFLGFSRRCFFSFAGPFLKKMNYIYKCSKCAKEKPYNYINTLQACPLLKRTRRSRVLFQNYTNEVSVVLIIKTNEVSFYN